MKWISACLLASGSSSNNYAVNLPVFLEAKDVLGSSHVNLHFWWQSYLLRKAGFFQQHLVSVASTDINVVLDQALHDNLVTHYSNF